MANIIQNILVLFAHPRYENSRIQESLINSIKLLPGVRIHDLYEEYPEFNIDVKREQELLLEHDIIVWMHPFYWYSAPPIMKQWIDLVLEYGWAYGKDGTQLKDKIIFNCISSGGSRESYQADGFHGYTVHDFLRPFQRTATLCNMNYLPPFFVHGSHRITDEELNQRANLYMQVLTRLSQSEFKLDELLRLKYLNDWE
jgi:glutathione-regulated potassium-efflux system ancillary protein KefG